MYRPHSKPEPFSDQQAFYDMTRDLFLVQHVEKPIRYREGQKPSLLDLILTDNDMYIDEIYHASPLGKSDHEVLHFTTLIYDVT